METGVCSKLFYSMPILCKNTSFKQCTQTVFSSFIESKSVAFLAYVQALLSSFFCFNSCINSLTMLLLPSEYIVSLSNMNERRRPRQFSNLGTFHFRVANFGEKYHQLSDYIKVGIHPRASAWLDPPRGMGYPANKKTSGGINWGHSLLHTHWGC